MRETGVATLITWVSGMLYNQKDFDLKEEVHQKSIPVGSCMYSSNVFALFLFILGDRKKKQTIYMSVVIFHCYRTIGVFFNNKVCSKSLETEAVFTNSDINNE